MAYEFFYEGTPYGLEPSSDKVYTGFQLPAGSIGAPTSIQTANQIQEVSNLLNTGMKPVEVSALQPETFEMIPKQHLKEIDRQAKLVGASISMHGPVIEPSGFTQQGWSEQNRELAERQLTDVAIRSHEMSPDKPMPITIHASMVPGTEKMPIDMFKEEELTPEEKEMRVIPTQMIAANQETGEIRPLRREKMYFPGIPEGKIETPKERLDILNNSLWSQQLSQIALYKKEADDILRRVREKENETKAIQQMLAHGNDANGNPLSDEQKAQLQETFNQNNSEIQTEASKANLFLTDVAASFRNVYEEAVKYAGSGAKENLVDISNTWKKGGNISEILDKSLIKMQEIPTPRLYKPIEDFAIDKASKTFANVAWEAYDKFGDKAPIISIENPPYGLAISTAGDLRKLIKESREKFVEKAVKEGMSETKAEKAAEAMIGATWDTAHISMMRKQGFEKEELVKEAEKIAPFVKHVHLNDNFGFSHTDLPPGMGSVPIKKILDKFKKEGFEGRHIFEGAQFFQHFKTAPHAMVLEAMSSPLYSVVANPTWTQTYGTTGAYAMGYTGAILPEQNFSTYGAGFSGLPAELGGQIPGKQSRFGGTPMA